jgi:hypothetical protein
LYIKETTCPTCHVKVVVDGALWEIGNVRLRCPNGHMFLPEGSSRSRTIESVANANVPITIWEEAPGEP